MAMHNKVCNRMSSSLAPPRFNSNSNRENLEIRLNGSSSPHFLINPIKRKKKSDVRSSLEAEEAMPIFSSDI